ncbi:class I SAM-dependent methyltransferase [Alkalicoccus urumqiensis]|uniref:Class I SAM-dependent methyltransferase n=1 Tax=Alkalicoccus urumqiensis TaxID=1548213 RepID=A0A2P6MD88_ALKUR|nr:class I SAM-dependent methyltransferase [Alkalicoccus urumqiensis]PRO64248.1 class I SAM-dependent methyltransferase [Alkalicoccus urumqiensis]
MTKTEMYYDVLDQGAALIQKKEEKLYLEALAEAGEAVFQGRAPGNLEKEEEKQWNRLLNELPEASEKEEIRRAVQLAVLKGMKEAVQPHHALTPDAVAVFAGFLMNELTQKETDDPLLLWDPAAGAGNLMTACANQMTKDVHFIGAEPDETLMKLAFMNANLQGHHMDLFHQDSVSQPAVDHVHGVVSDLPLGYYPDDETASGFATAADEGHTYVHHLLMEKAVRHVREGGFLVFLVPNSLFQSEQAPKLHPVIKEQASVYALLQLPSTMFKTQDAGKSMLILRKTKAGIVPPKQALLAELPSFTRQEALADMTRQISDWIREHV